MRASITAAFTLLLQSGFAPLAILQSCPVLILGYDPYLLGALASALLLYFYTGITDRLLNAWDLNIYGLLVAHSFTVTSQGFVNALIYAVNHHREIRTIASKWSTKGQASGGTQLFQISQLSSLGSNASSALPSVEVYKCQEARCVPDLSASGLAQSL